jgi:uncharacterized protein (DUF1330 family)
MKAYLILDIEVHDLDAFRSYASEITEFVKKLASAKFLR